MPEDNDELDPAYEVILFYFKNKLSQINILKIIKHELWKIRELKRIKRDRFEHDKYDK